MMAVTAVAQKRQVFEIWLSPRQMPMAFGQEFALYCDTEQSANDVMTFVKKLNREIRAGHLTDSTKIRAFELNLTLKKDLVMSERMKRDCFFEINIDQVNYFDANGLQYVLVEPTEEH